MADRMNVAAPLSVAVSSRAGTVTISVSGELDLATLPRLEGSLVPIEPGGRLVVDLREVSFIDSSGVRFVMSLDVRSRAEGWALVIARRRGVVQRVLDLCGIPDRVTTVDDPADVA